MFLVLFKDIARDFHYRNGTESPVYHVVLQIILGTAMSAQSEYTNLVCYKGTNCISAWQIVVVAEWMCQTLPSRCLGSVYNFFKQYMHVIPILDKERFMQLLAFFSVILEGDCDADIFRKHLANMTLTSQSVVSAAVYLVTLHRKTCVVLPNGNPTINKFVLSKFQ